MLHRFGRLTIFAVVILGGSLVGDDEKSIAIKAPEARAYAGKKVEVVFKVKKTKHSAQRDVVYLDSEEDYRDEKNFGVFLFKQGQNSLKQARKIENPAEYYRGKTIRVAGVIELEEGRPYIKVTDADQLDLVKDKSPP
ncbi:MAG: hypothetical protein KF861_16580 [Planctomycetaceae bacterium]|nr:hypothetical protein [Planctomycetaceae bacterium]